MSKKFGLTFGSLALFLAIITPIIILSTFPGSHSLLSAFTCISLILVGVITILATIYKVSPYSYQNRFLPIVLFAVVALNVFSFLTKLFVSQFILYHFFLFFALLSWMTGMTGNLVFASDVSVALLKVYKLRKERK
jgi:hypothetical protein